MQYECLKKILLGRTRFNNEEYAYIAEKILEGKIILNTNKQLQLTIAGEEEYNDIKFHHDLEQKRLNFKGIKIIGKSIRPKFRKKLNA